MSTELVLVVVLVEHWVLSVSVCMSAAGTSTDSSRCVSVCVQHTGCQQLRQVLIVHVVCLCVSSALVISSWLSNVTHVDSLYLTWSVFFIQLLSTATNTYNVCFLVSRRQVWWLMMRLYNPSPLLSVCCSPHVHIPCFQLFCPHFLVVLLANMCLQCFDAVGWAAGRASGL